MTEHASPAIPRLQASGLHLHYQDRGPFAFSLSQGECVCISGPSGMGKSLLLRALADLDPNRGEVWLDGSPRHAIPAPQWRQQVTLLPAESRWWEQTVGGHFYDGQLPDDTWLAALGFGHDVLAWTVNRLSSGERQRLALLRVLARRPKVLLLDEPTANLDLANVTQAETLVRNYRQATGAAVVWVSHNLRQISRVADRHAQFTVTGLVWG